MGSNNSRPVRLGRKMRSLLVDFKVKNNLRSVGDAGEILANDMMRRRKRKRLVRELEL